jgi:RNA polymerase-associated protein CTR9
MALVNVHTMTAHLHLALARTAPKELPERISKLVSQELSEQLTYILEYDILPAGTKRKGDHIATATQHLNSADSALKTSGMGPDEEPSSLATGKCGL